MKKAIIFLILFASAGMFSQEFKKDHRIQLLKEDGLNEYNSDIITNLDILEALAITGVRINKYHIGKFDKLYNITVLVDEYKDNSFVRSDTVFTSDNSYTFWERGDTTVYSNYIDQLKVISIEEDNKLKLHVHTYRSMAKHSININKLDEGQYFMLRSYQDTKWEINKKVPLLIYASSWFDESAGGHRFCGVVKLSENDEMTKELLSYSPNYFVLSYRVTEIEK